MNIFGFRPFKGKFNLGNSDDIPENQDGTLIGSIKQIKSALDDKADKNPTADISVTANGVDNWTAIFNSMVSQIDFSKITSNTALKIGSKYLRIASADEMSNNTYLYMFTGQVNDNIFEYVTIRNDSPNTSQYRRKIMPDTSVNWDANVPASGTKISIYY